MDIKQIIQKYRFSREIKRFSMNENNNRFYASIQSKQDIERYQIYAFNAYESISKIYPIHEDDLEQMKRFIKDYEICVNKGITMMDSIIGKWDITAEELMEFINKLTELYELYDKFGLKKLYQD